MFQTKKKGHKNYFGPLLVQSHAVNSFHLIFGLANLMTTLVIQGEFWKLFVFLQFNGTITKVIRNLHLRAPNRILSVDFPKEVSFGQQLIIPLFEKDQSKTTIVDDKSIRMAMIKDTIDKEIRKCPWHTIIQQNNHNYY